MLARLILAICTVVLGCLPAISREQTRSVQPEKVSVCQLKNDPAAYNHKLIEVTGFISHGFEDFTLFEPTCRSSTGIWLEYGGTRSSGTIYCCGVSSSKTRPKQLVIEDTPIALVEDEWFRKFDELLQGRRDSILHATLVGRFFSGKQENYGGGNFWGGYGHMGCCSLLAIEQVLSLDTRQLQGLDYGASIDQPEISKVGCGYRILPGDSTETKLLFQKKSESAEREWSFADPQRVALEGLARSLKVDEKSISGLKVTRQAQGRVVYQWKSLGTTYMIVVNRPYALSFYATDAKKVAWVVAAVYEVACD